jgi:amino acid transporter
MNASPNETKAFGLWSAIFLGIGSMVGAGIFIVIGEAGAIAGSLVTASFLLSGFIALLCGYSLSKLAVRYPSRGGIIEYLSQLYGEGLVSGSLGVLFYFAQLVALAAVAKSFGTYAASYAASGPTPTLTNACSLGVLALFVSINLIGAAMVARAENYIVTVKLCVLVAFTVAALWFIDPTRLAPAKAPAAINISFTLGLTFFAYQGFSVITNSVEDMRDPARTMPRAMTLAVLLVAVMYISISVAVFGSLSLETIVKDRDFALAAAVRPVFGAIGFKIMAATALLATASAINATLYAVTQISYTLAKDGDLPKAYEYSVFHNTEGLLISAALIVPMVLLFDLGQIATIAAISVLLIQGFTHAGHFFKRTETSANGGLVALATLGTFGAAGFALVHAARTSPHFVIYIVGIFALAILFEAGLRLITNRSIMRQVVERFEELEDSLVAHIGPSGRRPTK